MNPPFHLMHRKLSLVGKVIGLMALCLLAYLLWRPGMPAAPRHAHAIAPRATTHNPAGDRDTLEALPEPVQRLISEGPQKNATHQKWKGAGALPQNEQQSLWQAFSQARHEIRPLTDYQKTLPENKDARYLASNPGQQLRARFLENGMRLLPDNSNRTWSGVIGLDSPGSMPEIAQDGSALQYRHAAGVTEWFENRPDGIEHGFIVREDSALNKQAQLQIPVRLDGLKAETMEGSNNLRLVNPEGETVLTYERLQVWDADGVELAAHMAPSPGGLQISVNAAGARFPVVIDPLILSQQTLLKPDIPGCGEIYDVFAASVSISGNTALIGAPLDDDRGVDSGSAYIFVRNNSVWTLQQKLTASDGAAEDHFGEALSLSGDTALIGASQTQKIGNGKAYVFVRSNSTWSLQQTLTVTFGSAGDAFGASVSLSGNTALIGAPYCDKIGSLLDVGFAYIFVRSGTTWTQQATLGGTVPATSDRFGSSLSLDGDTALVGCSLDDDNGSSSGSAYVFFRSGTTWSLQQKLIASDAAAAHEFGFSVSLSGDTALIGSPIDVNTSGSAYVFVRSGTTWNQQQKLIAPDGAPEDYFGKSISLSGDIALIAAEGDDGPVYAIQGSAYVFVRTGSTWAMEQKFTPPADMPGGVLGMSVSLSGDTLLIGVLETQGNDRGCGFVFVRNNAIWTQQQILSAGDGAAYDSFGVSVSLAGETALVGTYKDDDNGTDTGSAYVFTRNGGIWSTQQKLIAWDGATSTSFGKQVSLSGDTALIAAYGAAYVFVRNGTVWSQQQKLTASDGTSGDYAISLSGDTALIGARSNTSNGSASGAAYVYQRSGTSWSEEQKLLPADGRLNDHFGVAVSLWNNTALIGVDGDDNKGEASGSVYVFVRGNSSWGQQQILTASDGAAGDFFGYAVSLWEDSALIGAYGDDDQGTSSGSAYVFVRSGSSWSQQKKLLPSDGQANAYFGSSVSISRASALVGSYGFTSNGFNSGSAYLFWRSGPNWSQQQKLTAPDAAAYDNFGAAVCISDYSALVGVYMDDGLDSLGGYAPDQGSVYVYQNSNPDVDGDGLLDIYETGTKIYVSENDTGTDPFNPDSDDDGLTDGQEVNTYGTNPNFSDTDNDNYLDATEVFEGGNPLDDSSTPGMRPQITPAKCLTFFSREGVNYRIEGSATGLTGTWTQLVGPIFGTGQALSVVVTTPPPFLRVVASL
jgi:hypothetical protein